MACFSTVLCSPGKSVMRAWSDKGWSMPWSMPLYRVFKAKLQGLRRLAQGRVYGYSIRLNMAMNKAMIHSNGVCQ